MVLDLGCLLVYIRNFKNQNQKHMDNQLHQEHAVIVQFNYGSLHSDSKVAPLRHCRAHFMKSSFIILV
jgi:hypothetical protein